MRASPGPPPSVLYISPLSFPASSEPPPPDSIVVIKHRCKPVSVLLKQFSKAQGHSSNIPLLCLFSTRRARAAAVAGENSGPPHLWPFDWLLYLGPESIGASLTDRCRYAGWLWPVWGEILPSKADFFQLFLVLQGFKLTSVNIERSGTSNTSFWVCLFFEQRSWSKQGWSESDTLAVLIFIYIYDYQLSAVLVWKPISQCEMFYWSDYKAHWSYPHYFIRRNRRG